MSRKAIDLIFSLLIVLLFAWVIWEAQDWPFRTRLFPWTIGLPLLGLALVHVALVFWGMRRLQPEFASTGHPAPSPRGPDGTSGSEDVQAGGAVAQAPPAVERPQEELSPSLVRRRTLTITLWTLAFFLGLWLLGFKIGSALLTFAFLKFGANESWKISLVSGGAAFLFFLLVFDLALAIPFPPGLIAESLGLQSFDSYVVEPILRALLRR